MLYALKNLTCGSKTEKQAENFEALILNLTEKIGGIDFAIQETQNTLQRL